VNLIIFIQVLSREPAVNATDPSIAFDRIPNRHVARILHWEHRSWTPKARESRRRRLRGMWGLGRGWPPPQPTRGSGERRELPQRGPGGVWHIWGPQNTSGRENSVTLLDVQSLKSVIFNMKMMHKVKIQTIIHCVSKTHEKNVSQIRGMAWLASPLCLWLRPWFTVKQAS